MLERVHISSLGLLARLGGVVALIVLAIGAGLWLGEKSVPIEEGLTPGGPDADASGKRTESERPAPPPLYFLVHIPSGAAQTAALEEVAMAAAAGIHQYVIDLPLPWQGDMNAFMEPLALLTQTDPEASLLLYLHLDPPPPWLAANLDEAARVGGEEPVYASLTSEKWRQAAHTALEALISAVNAAVPPDRILGYLIGCLEEGRWCRTNGYDASPANLAGFRAWLKTQYKEDAALQGAWDDDAMTLDMAAIPEKPDTTSACQVFFPLPAMQRHVDFLRYTSESTADAIKAFTGFIKHSAGKETRVIALYGYTFELTTNEAGHFALARLLDSDLDGFASPISHLDRGPGGVGGLMGPVDSALAHGKQWYLIDDTRTGITRDTATGEITRPKNLRAEDVYGVQERNFAGAVCRGLGLFWADPEGDGRLHDQDMWQRLARMWNVYKQVDVLRAAVDENTPGYPSGPTLAVVVDENARFYMDCDKKLSETLLNQVRDCALRSGVPTKFYLLSDVLAQRVPAASVYLFLNAFRLAAEQRDRLHAFLAQNRAAAIWMYAPGYMDQTASVDNISATTRVKVKAFDGPAQTGSVCLLPGKWIGKDEEFGTVQEVEPLFYVDDALTDVIANYRASGKASVSVSFFEEGWASIFCADPGLTAPLLRELLAILELHMFFQTTNAKFFDVALFGPNLMAIHAKDSGDRVVDLDKVCDVQDLFIREVGWPRKRTFAIPLKTGETRLLKLSPLETEEAP